MEQQLAKIIEQSFLQPFLEQPQITDLSFNGKDFYVQDNLQGRRKETVWIEDTTTEIIDNQHVAIKQKRLLQASDVELLIRKIADQRGKQFTNEEPILDTEIGNLRLNAVHSEISPFGVTLALRVSKPRLSITDPSQVAPVAVITLLETLVKSEANIVISGKTGSGKTEFQKYLVGAIPETAKICLLEDTMDSHLKQLYPAKDINSWRTLTHDGREKAKQIQYDTLIRASLRNNPDYVIVAESRGSEAYDVLQAALTDHAIITTLHANSASAIPARLMSMIRQEYQIADAVLGKDLVDTLKIGVHLAYEQVAIGEGKYQFQRYIREVVEFTDYDLHQGVTYRTLYQRKKQYEAKTDQYQVIAEYGRLSASLCQRLKDYECYHQLPEQFQEEEDEKISAH